MSTPSLVPSATASTTRAAFRGIVVLVSCYLGLSVLTIVAAVIMRNNTALVNDAVWIRGSIVAVTAALMLRLAVGASSGDARHYLRLRIVSAIMVGAIAVILVALSADFPMWMLVEQAVCGLILVAVVVVANSRRIRRLFASVAVRESAAAN